MFSHEWPIVRRLIATLAERFPGVPIVCGGEHPTAVPERCLDTAPALAACAIGEGEQTAVDLADAIARGEPLTSVPGLVVRTPDGHRATASRDRIRNVDAIPRPRWDLTPIEAYLRAGYSFGVSRGRTMPILGTRGCPYRCTFCSSPTMWTTRYAVRDPRSVVDEIADYAERFGARNFDFYDLTFIIHRDWLIDFCHELLRAKLPVTWQLPSGTRSEAIDREVCELLYRSGCRNISYAPESGSVRSLRIIQKRANPDRMLASMADAVASGLNVKANILIGFPHETDADMRATLRFIARMARAGVHDVSVWTFAPYPGSALFEELLRRGRLGDLDDDYYASLLSYSNLTGASSYCDALSARALEGYRLAGLSLFYAISYGLNPARPLRSALNLASGRLESRMEMSLANLLRRVAREPALASP
jgi:radical SAM superfamily enzyme YgiQ (UPF0313 family)